MKKGRTILVGSAILLTSTFYAFTQLQQNNSIANPNSEDPLKAGPPIVYLNERTFEVTSLDGNPEKVKHLNTDELKFQRWKDSLALTHPEEFRRQFPLSAEQVKVEEAARYAISHPHEAYEKVRGTKTQEDLAREEELRKQIMGAFDAP